MASLGLTRVRRLWARASHPPLYRAHSRLPTSENAAAIHAFTRRNVLALHSRRGRLGLRLQFAIWHAGVPVRVLLNVVWNGVTIRRRTGKSLLRQAREQLAMAWGGSINPKTYYAFRLYEPEAGACAGDYLHRFETKKTLYRFLRSKAGRGLLEDKVEFARACQRHGVRTVPVLMEFREGQAFPLAAESLPRQDLVVKPSRGRGGRKIERWSHREDDRYESSGGVVLDRDALTKHLGELSLAQPWLVQPRLVNHPDLADLSNGVLMTVRMLSCTNEAGEGEVTNASFRLGGDNPVVDNMHRGGIAAAVDLRTGRVGRAMGLPATADWLVKHPSTGAPIAGRLLPDWHEAIELASQAHGAFSDCFVIGWDVALLEDGPCIIEGNRSPCVNLIQRPLGGPIGSGRFGELAAHRIRKLEAEERSGT